MTDLDLTTDGDRRAVTLFGSNGPSQIVQLASNIAAVLKPLIKDRALYKHIGQSDHVYLEGWTLAGTMLGVFPITVASGPIFDPDGQVVGYQATVEARTMGGSVVGRADAECTRDENEKWHRAPSFQLRSMAQTRASSKALRMPLGFIMQLAGYDSTPAEEMEAAAARGETVTGGRGVAPGWRDKAEQERAFQDLAATVTTHGLGEWVARWIDDKGYPRPLAKGQFRQLQRAIERELEESGRQGGDHVAQPAGPTSAVGAQAPPGPAADQASPEARTVKGKDGKASGDDPEDGDAGAD